MSKKAIKKSEAAGSRRGKVERNGKIRRERPIKLACGHYEWARGHCGEMSCTNYAMKGRAS